MSMDAATDQTALPSPPLVLHAPLSSTRRSSTSLCSNAGHSSSALRLRVPFSWESSPGVPRSRVNDSDSDDPPPPKLPPGRRWADDEANGNLVRVLGYDPYASGASSEEEGEEDLFSDALEKISASDRFDVACRLSSFSAYKSPGFIMDRFLPAANALAKSSVRHRDGRRRGRDSSPSHQLQREAATCRARIKQRALVLADDPRRHTLPPLDNPYAEARAEPPSMACGLMLFFPWSFKPTVCGFKSPARTAVTPRSAGLCSTPNKLCTSSYIDQGTSSVRNPSDGWSSDEEDNGGGGRYVEKLSVKVRHSHGWRMPFLDTSRSSSSTASRVEQWKGKAIRKRVGGHDAERKERRSNEAAAPAPESRSRLYSLRRLPQLASPSQSWLSQALGAINKKP